MRPKLHAKGGDFVKEGVIRRGQELHWSPIQYIQSGRHKSSVLPRNFSSGEREREQKGKNQKLKPRNQKSQKIRRFCFPKEVKNREITCPKNQMN